jgi:diguanylate cyclase (GGDEF)-like protein
MDLTGTSIALPDVTLADRLARRPAVTLLRWMRPRDPKLAARTVSALCAIGILVTLVTLPLGANAGTDPHGWAVALAVVSLLFAATISATAWFFDEASSWAWALCPFAAVHVIVLVDLATSDASIPAQVFFVFPTVYGASLLPRPGAILVTCAALAGELTVVFALLPAREAVVNSCYVVAALVTVSVMLIHSMERQQHLVVELARLAMIDPLTGLVTRRSFDEAASRALAQRDSDAGTSLLIFDVDKFKSVNDQYGHPGGDKVLVQLSQLLMKASRTGDVVCRMGGDEMAMLLPRCTADIAVRRAEEIVELVRNERFAISVDDLIQVSVSAGVAHSSTDGADLPTLYVSADAALYDAKHGGRDRVVTR